MDNNIGNIDTSGQNPNDSDQAGDGFGSSNGDFELPSDIEALFGNVADDNATGTQPTSGSNAKPFEGTFDSKDPEELLRSLQSQRDKLDYKVKQLETQTKELKGAEEFVHALYEDPEVRRAFIAQVEPSLVQQNNPEDYIKNGLAKEFGKEFVPDPDEENIRGSRSWLYNKRADDLYTEYLQNKTKVPETLTTLREKRKKEKEAQQAQVTMEKTRLLQELKWDENEYNSFIDWANKLRLKDLALVREFVKKASKPASAPHLGTVPGGKQVGKSYFHHLDSFFGA